jgi:hypothetical protein
MDSFSRLLRTLAVLLLLVAGTGRASAAVSLGNAEVGHTVTLVIPISGSPECNGPITYIVTGDNAADFHVTGPATRVAGETFGVSIQFTPSDLGIRTASVEIDVGPPDAICAGGIVDLTGTGVPPTGTGGTPTIVCPANITRNTDSNQCGAVVNYPLPTAVGAAGAITCSPASGSFFPKGTTTVNCTSTSGATCSFTVTVRDTQAPAIICPPSIILPQDAGRRAATFVPSPAVATDNCPGVVVTGSRSDGIPLTDPTYPVGATVITWTATDTSGNQASCTQSVNVHNSRIVGVVGLDTNGDHLPDPLQEPRLKGVVIELRDPERDAFWAANPATKQPEPLDQTTTDQVGNFTFLVAPPGVYDVVVRLAPGQTISALFPGPSTLVQVVTVNGEPRLRVTMQAGATVAGLGILLQ